MTALPLTDAFGRYLTDERQFSPYTARCYGADLKQFIDYLIGHLKTEPDVATEQPGGAGGRRASRRAAGADPGAVEGRQVVDADSDELGSVLGGVFLR